mmetsp:Transcript_178563/g.572341  ORF Transcript_178563/g.572341 Transcript_178563/m.572341 type:complete len:255 (+) Transcript_178563:1585-2349(+)
MAMQSSGLAQGSSAVGVTKKRRRWCAMRPSAPPRCRVMVRRDRGPDDVSTPTPMLPPITRRRSLSIEKSARRRASALRGPVAADAAPTSASSPNASLSACASCTDDSKSFSSSSLSSSPSAPAEASFSFWSTTAFGPEPAALRRLARPFFEPSPPCAAASHVAPRLVDAALEAAFEAQPLPLLPPSSGADSDSESEQRAAKAGRRGALPDPSSTDSAYAAEITSASAASPSPVPCSSRSFRSCFDDMAQAPREA